MGFDFYRFYEALESSGARIRLDAGDPDHQPPAEVVEAARQGLGGGLGYTPAGGLRELRERIAEIHGVDLNEVVVTPGAKAAIAALIRAARRVGVFAPYWPGYRAAASLFGRRMIARHLSERRGWAPSQADVEWLASRVDLVIVNYPNNPTGAVIDRARARTIVDTARDRGVVVVSDEAYRDLAFDGSRLVMAELESEGVASVYSFSKTFAVPGLRVGYVVGDPSLVAEVRRFIAATYTGVPRFAQAAALKALDVLEEAARRAREAYKARLEAALRVLDEEVFTYTRPKGGLYIFLKARLPVDGAELAYRLAEKGIGVFPGEAFGGARYRRYLRVSLTAPAADLEQGLRAAALEARRLAGGRLGG